MNIYEAAGTGRPFQRPTMADWIAPCPSHAEQGNFCPEWVTSKSFAHLTFADLWAVDWLAQESTVTITRAQFQEAVDWLLPTCTTNAQVRHYMDAVANRLGFT